LPVIREWRQEARMQRKGIDKMPAGVSESEIVARLAFGSDFDNSTALEQSRVAHWWSRQRWFTRLRFWLAALGR
jgi:hypothetical protein